jgi:hypothetical protein
VFLVDAGYLRPKGVGLLTWNDPASLRLEGGRRRLSCAGPPRSEVFFDVTVIETSVHQDQGIDLMGASRVKVLPFVSRAPNQQKSSEERVKVLSDGFGNSCETRLLPSRVL